MKDPSLLADIGGTHARFALFDATEARPRDERVLICAEFAGLADAVESYLVQVGGPRPRQAAIAVATAVTGDHVAFTNSPWAFSVEQARTQLRLERLEVVNDFTALALSTLALAPGERRQVGGGSALENAPAAVLGPGTGLGVSGLIACAPGHWVALHSEGGHVTFSPASQREADILQVLRERFAHVSAERVISGAGLVNVYQALARLDGVQARALSPAEVSAHATDGSDPRCREALETFCAMLGTAAGNLALTLGARGGVYLGGGIVPKIGTFLDGTAFRERFEQKGRMTGYLSGIATYVILARHPALLGAARLLDDRGR